MLRNINAIISITNAACSYAELGIPLFPGIPLPVLDDVPVATVDLLPIPPTLPPDPPECVAKYAQYLKDMYEGMSTLPDGDWPPSLGKQYTRLAVIEQKRELPGAELVATMERDYIHGNIDNIVKRKKAIQLHEIFLPTEDGGQQLKILMDGAPGVGKSTLSRKICKDWASGQLLQQYHLVILLPLRQASIRQANTIEDLIEVDNPDLKQQVIRHIQETSGEHVLLILDGYDELSNEDRTQKSLFLDIVRGNKFPKCSVLVTSRPYASDYLQQLQSINRHVEVLGFTEEQIEHCIMENIPDKAKAIELVQMLKERQDIASLCYIPLNCAIVLYVYEREQCTLPHSLTKLYETFIVNALKRHVKVIGNDPRSTRRLNTLKNLPEPLQQQLSALSTLAYNGLVADKMVFSTDDLEAVFPDCSDPNIECSLLSLMTAFKEFTSTDEELSYQFLHLTIQEFLAARWAASQLSAGELLKFFQDHLHEERYRMVLLFLAGISQLKFASAEDLFRDELDCKHPVSREYSNRKVVDYFLFLAHLIYESQNFSLFHNLASTIAGAELFAAWYRIAPFDCLVLAHFLVWCDCLLKSLDLRGCGLTYQFHEIIHRVSLQHHGTTQIEEVCLSYNPKIIETLSLLSQLPMFECTRVLIACGLQYPEQVSYNQLHLHSLLNMRHLTTLHVSVNKNPDVDSAIYLSLNRFLCQHVNIDSQNAVHIFRSLQHNTSLEELDLSRNKKLAEGDSEAVGCAIERMLSLSQTLKVLNLYCCGMTNELASYFASGLTQNHSVREVILHSNNIGSTGAVSIFRSLEHNTSLEELDLSENRQLAEADSEAVGCATERMLNVNRKLKYLNLSGCNVTDPIVKHILTGLMKNTSLVTLKMRSPTLSVRCAVSLLQQMTTHLTLSITVDEVNILGVGRVKMDRGSLWCVIGDLISENCVEFFTAVNNSGLKVSNLNVQDLTDQTAEHFAVGLAESQWVQALKLKHCYIRSTGAVSILTSLEHNSSLDELDLSGNSQLAEGDSEAVGCAIDRMLKVNRTLKVLNLTDCRLKNKVVSYFANGLAQNHSVRKVILHSNSIGSTGAVSIFISLEHNTSLEELDLSENRQPAEGDSEAVGCAIERMLNVNRTLKVLTLSGCNVTDTIVKHILIGLTKNTSLVTLDMRSPKLSGSCAVSLFQQKTTHHTLSRVYVGEVNVLGIGRVEMDRGCLWCVTGDMIPENCVEFFRALNNSGLKVSKLNVQDLTNRTAERFTVGLAESQSVQALKLKHCNITSTGAVSIFRSLELNTSLEELDLSGNSQLVEGDSEAVGCAIERMLNVNKTLTVLNLSSCRLDTTVATHTAAGLVHNASLEELNIGGNIYSRNNIISSEGWIQLFKALCNNTSLKKLDITLNDLGMEGSVALAEMLSCNKSLTELNLEWCHIPEDGFTEIARGLLQNTSLKKLDISHKLGMEGSVALAEMLSCNKSLTELNLRGYDIPEAGLREIARGLLQNTSLQTLNLWSTKHKTILKAEIERLKKSGNFTP